MKNSTSFDEIVSAFRQTGFSGIEVRKTKRTWTLSAARGSIVALVQITDQVSEASRFGVAERTMESSYVLPAFHPATPDDLDSDGEADSIEPGDADGGELTIQWRG